jgi:hypothetical protein
MQVAWDAGRRYKNTMKPAARAIVLVGILVAGCDTAHNVVVSSYHVATAPVRYARRHMESPPTDTASTTTTTVSDVSTPGRPVAETSPTAPSRVTARNSTSADSTSTRRPSGSKIAGAKPKPSPAPAAPQFPVAKVVPGKPGLVFNPFDAKGAYIDVSGYASGSKVKDPESQKIFIVP